MNDWLKVLVPLAFTVLLSIFGFLLNQGRVANCQATNETRSIMREILLTVPDDSPSYQRFLDRSLSLLEPRDCSLL